MAWTSLVPIRIGIAGKSRLDTVLDAAAREKLAITMAHHVIDVLTRCPAIGSVTVLSNMRFPHPATTWAKDEGRGLNPEISAFREGYGSAPLVVMHADLPLLEEADVEALLAAATGHGIALATDRAGEGTNALALADGRPFNFRFGPRSRSLHCAQDADLPVLQHSGLSADLDTPDDLAFLRERGLQF